MYVCLLCFRLLTDDSLPIRFGTLSSNLSSHFETNMFAFQPFLLLLLFFPLSLPFLLCRLLPFVSASSSSRSWNTVTTAAAGFHPWRRKHGALFRSSRCYKPASRCIHLIIFLNLAFFLRLLPCMPHRVKGHEMERYRVLRSQERLQASLDIDGEVSASGRGLKLLVAISEGIRRLKEQKEIQSGAADDSFEVSRLAIQVTSYEQDFDGFEVGVSQEDWPSESFVEGQEEEEDYALFDQLWDAATDHESADGTLACFSVRVQNLMRHAFSDAMPLFDQSEDPPTIQSSLTSVPNVAVIPSFLEWSPQSLFSPRLASLTVLNTCKTSELHVFRPFSTNPQFSIFGFKEARISPGGTLSINVVFLPTNLGPVEGLLVVQTNAGGFLVQVRGEGIKTPYRLRPLSALRAVSGMKLQHPIFFYNPYDEPLHVEEVYIWLLDSDKQFMNPFDAETSRGKGILCKRDILSEEGAMRRVGWMQFISDGGGSSNFNGRTIELNPSGDWIIGPHSSRSIVDVQLKSNSEDTIMGILCIRVARHLQRVSETVILPLEVQSTKRTSISGKVYAIPEALDFGVLNENQRRTQGIVLANPGPDFLRVKRILTSSADSNIVAVEYAERMTLDPGTEVQVASITYAAIEQEACWLYNRRDTTNSCQLIIQTNSTDIQVPYRAVVLHGPSECLYLDSSSEFRDMGVAVEDACLKPKRRLHLQNGFEVPFVILRKLEKRARAVNPELDELRGDTELDSHAIGSQSVLETPELLFPTVQLSMEEVQWVTVSNPNDRPVKMELMVSSEAVASHCKNGGESGVNHVLGQVEYATGLRFGLSVMEGPEAIRRGIFSVAEDGVSDALVPPKSKATLGPIVFRPAELCVWTSGLVIRNNLTRMEWMPMQGTGGSSGLTFLDGDNNPVQILELDFNLTPLVPPLTAGIIKQHINELIDHAGAKASCRKRITREFLAKNNGDMPLQVESMSLTNGVCDSHGFRLDTCNGFYLAPGQARQLLISYQPDFSGVFSRELEISTSFGMFTIPLRVNLAPELLPFCQKPSFFLKFEKLLLHICLIALFLVLMIFIKMLKQERLSPATDSRHWTSSRPTELFSPGELKIGRKGKDCGRQRQKGIDSPSLTRNCTHTSNDSTRNSNYCRVFTVARNFVNLVKSSFGSLHSILPDIKVKLSKIETPVAGLTKLNAGSTKQGNSCANNPCTNNGNKLADRKGSPSPAVPMNANQGGSKSSGTNAGATNASIIIESSQQQTLPATMPARSVPSSSPSPTKAESDARQTPASQSHRGSHISSKTALTDERKDKGKRKKKKSNVSTTRQEMENGSRSGNSSPVSSPHSPGTPVNASRPVSPFLPSGSLSSAATVLISGNGASLHSRDESQGYTNCADSSQLEIHSASELPLTTIDASCTALQTQVIPVTNASEGVEVFDNVDKGRVTHVNDWVSVEGEAMVPPEAVHAQDSDTSLGTWGVNGSVNPTAVVTHPTVPGDVRRNASSVSTSPVENKPSMNASISSTSQVSSSVLTPIGRAPGTRLCIEKAENDAGMMKDCGSVYSEWMASSSTEQDNRKKVQEVNDFVYDIWGDHFAEISRGPREGYASLDGTHLCQTLPLENSRSLFAKSSFISSTSNLSGLPSTPRSSRSPDSGLSVFSTTNPLFVSHRLSPLLSDWIPEH